MHATITAVVARAWFVWLILTSLGNTGRCRCAPEYWMGSLGTLSRSYHFQQIALIRERIYIYRIANADKRKQQTQRSNQEDRWTNNERDLHSKYGVVPWCCESPVGEEWRRRSSEEKKHTPALQHKEHDQTQGTGRTWTGKHRLDGARL